MSAYFYPIALAGLSLLVLGLELLFPARPDQPLLRRTLASDVVHLVFNGHFLGVLVYGFASRYVLPSLSWAELGVARDWPLWVQIPLALLLVDFLQWGVHRLLHAVPWLWRLHQVHHSVVDGEMSWIASFRFHWVEVVVYKSLLYFPLALLGFGGTAMMTHAVVGTLIGHLNHANLPWDYGPLRFVLNNPRMHLWHHDADAEPRATKNFGIIFSCWDWLFGTASMPDGPPRALGYAGVERMPVDFFSQELWPLVPRMAGARRFIASGLGAAVIAGAWWWLA